MELSELKRRFQSPDASLRAKPFWAWNGDLKEKELFRQIAVMKEMGFGGFFMHSRTGLETEYLGEEWFRLISRCADRGAEEQMEAWLYDEDRWPSGSAGGLVTKEKRFRSMYLEMRKYSAEEYPALTLAPGETEVLRFSCRLDGTSYTDGRVLSEGEPPREGETVLLFVTRYSEKNDNYNGYTYLDTMNREAADAFLTVTHEAYKKHCGDKFGKQIRGIFTDEPHRGALFTFFSEGKENAAPFTPKLFEEFEKRFSYSLVERLPELFLRKEGRGISPVPRDYIELCQELFLENFVEPIYRWCDENGLELTGHALHEDCLCAQTIMQGSLMRFYEFEHRPGVDVLGTHNDCYWIVKQAASVARQQGKKWLLSELNGCTGWQTSLQTYKNIGDWQRMLGVNLRCPHLSWYTMKGEAKRDYPASILHQSTWYREYEKLETYFARLSVLLDEGEPDRGLLVVSPIESVWARAYSGAFDGLSARDSEIQRLEETYAGVFRALVSHQVDFDYGDEDHLARFGSVDGTSLKLGLCAYDRVLVAGCDTLRGSTLRLLRKFAAAGGRLIFAGDPPRYVDAVENDAFGVLAKRCVRIPCTPEALSSACRSGREVRISGEGAEEIMAQVRFCKGWRTVALLNTNRTEGKPALSVRTGDAASVCRWDPVEGTLRPVKAERDGTLSVGFFPGELQVYVLSEEEEETEAAAHFSLAPIPAPKYSALSYELDEPNLCVLDRFTVTAEDGERWEKTDVLRADRKLRAKYGYSPRGGEMLQPWYVKANGKGPETPVCEASLSCTVLAEEAPGPMELIVENLSHIRSVSVNGKKIPLVSLGKWIDICFDRLAVPSGFFTQGENTLRVELSYYATEGLEAMYLSGGFGVRLADGGKLPVLTGLPKALSVGDITPQGLPFYSGKITYRLPVPGVPAGSAAVLRAENFGGSCLLLSGNGKEKVLPFEPYESEIASMAEENAVSLTVVLTRRNTFGPLHMLPALVDGYGPDSFTTTGKHWSDSYVLLPQGLLKPPEFFVRKEKR